MSRYIHIADTKGRDAEIIFTSKPKKSSIKLVTEKGEEVHTIRVLKGSIKNSFEGMSKSIGEAEAIAQAIISSDPEIDLNLTGRFIKGSTRVYIDNELKPVSRITKKEIIHNPDGTVKEERIPNELLANILAEVPIKSGKIFPKKDIYNKLVFAKKYSYITFNGLTFDFLYECKRTS